jgi:hypothetical protein
MATGGKGEGSPRGVRVRLSGREPITHPLAPALIDLSHRLGRRELTGTDDAGAIALRAGRTMLTIGEGSELAELATTDLVEVADYDPIERLLLAVGPREPTPHAALLWLVLRHRDETGALILVPHPGDAGTPVPGLRQSEQPSSTDPLDLAKACLAALRQGDVVELDRVGLIATGTGVKGAERALMHVLARLDPARFAGDPWAAPEATAPTRRRNGGTQTGPATTQ